MRKYLALFPALRYNALILILDKTIESFYRAAECGLAAFAAENVVNTFPGAPQAQRRVTPQ